MSTIKDPVEKKRLAYDRDHYNRNGQHNKAWRRIKPLKKVQARRAYRKAANDLLRVCAADDAPLAATRAAGSILQRRVLDWGHMGLRDFVARARKRREADKQAVTEP